MSARCGTAAGYTAHQNRSEKPCDACVRAKAEYDHRWRAAPEQQRRSRLNALAQRKAYSTLAHRYPDEYAALYAQFKAAAFAESEAS